MFVPRGLLLAIILTIAASHQAFAQTTTANSQQQSDTFQQFDRMQALSQQIHESTVLTKPNKSIVPVLVAIPEVRKATEDLRAMVGENKDLRDSVRKVEKLFKPFEDYFDDLNLKAGPINTGEFKDYSGNEIVWETLTTAERIDNNLQITLRLLRESERSGSITIQTMVFLTDIQKDMNLFKFLADKVSTIRRLSD